MMTLGLVERKISRRTSHQATEMVQTTKTKVREKGKITHLVSIAEKWVTHHSSVGKDQMQSAVSAISLETKL